MSLFTIEVNEKEMFIFLRKQKFSDGTFALKFLKMMFWGDIRDQRLS